MTIYYWKTNNGSTNHTQRQQQEQGKKTIQVFMSLVSIKLTFQVWPWFCFCK